jgi:hypothetical protein
MTTETGETPTLKATIDAGVRHHLANVHTAMPATVVSYDASTGFAKVQPSIKRVYADGETVDLPKIINVPVVFPRAGKAFLHLPVTAGDCVLLVFSEASIDIWKAKGGKVDPQDRRRHALTDAYAIPGGYPKSMGLGADASAEDLTMANDQIQLVLKPAGKVQLRNKTSTDDLIGLVCDLFAAIVETGLTSTMLGPQPLVVPTYAALKAKIDAFREAL